jgi:hypothetical protein
MAKLGSSEPTSMRMCVLAAAFFRLYRAQSMQFAVSLMSVESMA